MNLCIHLCKNHILSFFSKLQNYKKKQSETGRVITWIGKLERIPTFQNLFILVLDILINLILGSLNKICMQSFISIRISNFQVLFQNAQMLVCKAVSKVIYLRKASGYRNGTLLGRIPGQRSAQENHFKRQPALPNVPKLPYLSHLFSAGMAGLDYEILFHGIIKKNLI